MSGILLFLVVGAWLWLALKIARRIAKSIENNVARNAAVFFLLPAVFLAPVTDEVVGAIQFQELCSGELLLIRPEARGKTVRMKLGERTRVQGQWLPTYRVANVYVDVATNKVVAESVVLNVNGGVLGRWIQLPPMFTGVSQCVAPELHEFSRKYELNVIN